VTELMKEDNPFIATAEEQERASRRIRWVVRGQSACKIVELTCCGNERACA
jgi:hypothetical protein